jgi:hypothetical protein
MIPKVYLALLLALLLVLPAIGLASAGITNLGVFKTGECISLKQSCASCTYNDVTRVTMPDSTVAINGILLMTKSGLDYNYTFCNTSQVGNYIVDGHGDLLGTDTVWNYNFQVTATGSDFSTGKSMTYILIFIFSFIIFIALLFFGIAVPHKNKTDEMTGYVIAVSNLKYVKLICLGFAYIFAVFIVYLSWMLSFAYLDLGFLSSILHFIFIAMAWITLPFFILFCYFTIANLIRDSQISEALSRGFQVGGREGNN